MNAEVHGVSRSLPACSSMGIRFWNGHLEDFSFVKKVIETIKPDYIFHLSGFVSGLREVNYGSCCFQQPAGLHNEPADRGSAGRL